MRIRELMLLSCRFCSPHVAISFSICSVFIDWLYPTAVYVPISGWLWSTSACKPNNVLYCYIKTQLACHLMIQAKQQVFCIALLKSWPRRLLMIPSYFFVQGRFLIKAAILQFTVQVIPWSFILKQAFNMWVNCCCMCTFIFIWLISRIMLMSHLARKSMDHLNIKIDFVCVETYKRKWCSLRRYNSFTKLFSYAGYVLYGYFNI